MRKVELYIGKKIIKKRNKNKDLKRRRNKKMRRQLILKQAITKYQISNCNLGIKQDKFHN